MTDPRLVSLDIPFAYYDNEGRTLLVEEVAHEVEVRLDPDGPSRGTLCRVLQSLRVATEKLASEGVVDPARLLPLVNQLLRRHQVLLTDVQVSRYLLVVMEVLGDLEIRGVHYHG